MAGSGGESVRVVTATSRRATTAVTAALVVVASVGTSLLVLTSTSGVAPSPDPRLPRTSPEAASPPGDVVVLPPRPGEGPVGRDDRSPEPAPTDEPVLGGDLLAEPVLELPLESEPVSSPTALPLDPAAEGPVLVPVVDEEPTDEEPAPDRPTRPRPRPGRGGGDDEPESTVGALGGSAVGRPSGGTGAGRGPTGPALPPARGHAHGLRSRVFDTAATSPFGLALREVFTPAPPTTAGRVLGPPAPELPSARPGPREHPAQPAPVRSPAAVDGPRTTPAEPVPPAPVPVPVPPVVLAPVPPVVPPPAAQAPPPRRQVAVAPPAKRGPVAGQRRSPRAAEAAPRPASRPGPPARGGRR